MSQGSESSRDRGDFSGIRALVIDDETTLQIGIEYALVAEGAEVDLAGSAVDGIALAKKNDYDVIILDRTMPEMDGIQCMQALRGAGNKTTIILMGMNLPPESILRCAECGVVDFLGKPLEPSRLREAVKRVLGNDESGFTKMLEAGRNKDWEGAMPYLSQLEPTRRAMWEVYLGLAAGRRKGGVSEVCKGGVCALGSFEKEPPCSELDNH